MIKKNIALYTKDDRMPISLRKLSLYPEVFVEDIFYAVNDAKDFADLTNKLGNIIYNELEIVMEKPNYIIYSVTIDDILCCFKIVIKSE